MFGVDKQPNNQSIKIVAKEILLYVVYVNQFCFESDRLKLSRYEDIHFFTKGECFCCINWPLSFLQTRCRPVHLNFLSIARQTCSQTGLVIGAWSKQHGKVQKKYLSSSCLACRLSRRATCASSVTRHVTFMELAEASLHLPKQSAKKLFFSLLSATPRRSLFCFRLTPVSEQQYVHALTHTHTHTHHPPHHKLWAPRPPDPTVRIFHSPDEGYNVQYAR